MSCTEKCQEQGIRATASLIRNIGLIVVVLCVTAVSGCWITNEWRVKQIKAASDSIDFEPKQHTNINGSPVITIQGKAKEVSK